jgi:creatinine amidohydrolase
MLDARNTSKEIRERLPTIALFGVGAVEQHSIHLPLGTDWLGVSDLTRRVAEALDAFLVPALPFSMSQCHGPMAGTVWLKPETLAAVVRDTVHSLAAQGFRQILIINGHGGNFSLEAEIRQINSQHPELIVLLVPPYLPPQSSDSDVWEKGVGIHANESETSHQLYINAGHVKSERVDYQPPVGREFLDYAFMGFISEWGVWGHPSYGTAEKARRSLARDVVQIADWATQTFAKVRALRAAERRG